MRRRMGMLAAAGATAVLLAMAPVVGAAGAQGPSQPRGLPVGEDFRISGLLATATDSQPAVAWNGTADEYLVVWMDYRNASTSGTDIYGQRLPATGERLGADFRIGGPAATANESDPAVAWNQTAGEYLVVWADQRNRAARGWDIAAQRVSATGERLGTNLRVSGPAAISDEFAPAVAWNPATNEYLIAWEDGRHGSPSSTDIYGQRLSAAGARLGANVRISGLDWSVSGLQPTVACSASAGECLVGWQDRRNESTSGYDIYGQVLSAAGARLGANFRVGGPGATGHDQAPGIAWNGTAGEFLVVWQDLRDAARDFDIYGRRVEE